MLFDRTAKIGHAERNPQDVDVTVVTRTDHKSAIKSDFCWCRGGSWCGSG